MKRTLLDSNIDRRHLAGRTYVVTDSRELEVTLDGSEEVEDGDTIKDVVSRAADEYPGSLWDLVDRDIRAA